MPAPTAGIAPNVRISSCCYLRMRRECTRNPTTHSPQTLHGIWESGCAAQARASASSSCACLSSALNHHRVHGTSLIQRLRGVARRSRSCHVCHARSRRRSWSSWSRRSRSNSRRSSSSTSGGSRAHGRSTILLNSGGLEGSLGL